MCLYLKCSMIPNWCSLRLLNDSASLEFLCGCFVRLGSSGRHHRLCAWAARSGRHHRPGAWVAQDVITACAPGLLRTLSPPVRLGCSGRHHRPCAWVAQDVMTTCAPGQLWTSSPPGQLRTSKYQRMGWYFGAGVFGLIRC